MGSMFVQVNGIRLGVEQRGAVGTYPSCQRRSIAPLKCEPATLLRATASQSAGSISSASASHSGRTKGVGKSDPTLVMLHGFTGSAAGWGSHLDTLAAYGLRVIALDLPGHGQSDAPNDPRRYAIEYCQQDILAALRELGVSPGEAVLLGYSMGGRVALYTAFSGFFRALIFESASPGLEDPAEREQRRMSDEALAASIERDGVPAFIDRWEKLPLFASQSSLSLEVREALHRQRLNNRAGGLAQSLRGLGTGVQPSLHARLPALHISVLLIAGELDTKFTAIARSMAQALPRSQLRIVPGAGHAVHLERPEDFDSLVGDFSLSMISSLTEGSSFLM